MMQPRSANMYVSAMNNVAEDFLTVMERYRKQNPQGEMPADFMDDVNKWALESICVVAFNKRLGNAFNFMYFYKELLMFLPD